jgi:hypothetical protein
MRANREASVWFYTLKLSFTLCFSKAIAPMGCREWVKDKSSWS